MKKLSIVMILVGSLFLTGANARADTVIPENVIIQGLTCIGLNCAEFEPFVGSTVKLKQDDTPFIRFEQVGIAEVIPPQIWDVGGDDIEFFIEDITNAESVPFGIATGAPNDSFYINSATI